MYILLLSLSLFTFLQIFNPCFAFSLSLSLYYFNLFDLFCFALKGTIEEQQELEKIRNAQQKVKYEISQLLTKYSEVAQQIAQLRREIHKLQTRSNSKSNVK